MSAKRGARMTPAQMAAQGIVEYAPGCFAKASNPVAALTEPAPALEPMWQCTKCGQVGSVGRCCGLNTRKPLNDAAQAESTPAPKGRGQWHPYRSKLEWRYYQHLLTQYEPSAIGYEELRLRLPSIDGKASIYTPDFALWCGCVVEYVDEVKGGHRWRRGGIDRLRAAAAKYPHLRFRLVEWVNNEWKISRVEG